MNQIIHETRGLLRLALPLAAAQAGLQLMGVVDTAVIGRLGAEELAAVGLGNALFFTVFIAAMGVVMGIDPLTAQAFGARDPILARRVLWQGVWLAIIVGGAVSVPLAFSPLMLAPFGVQASIIPEASIYTTLRIVGLIPMLLFVVFRSYLQAQGITRPMVISIAVANVFNLVADIYFVFGGGWLPEWTGPLRLMPAYGVAGAAVATIISSIVQLWILWIAVRSVRPSERTHEPWRLVPREFRQAFNIGLPLGLQFGAEVGIFALVGLLAGRLGADHLAAHQIAITLAAFTFTVAVGIGAAASVRVGHAIGAEDAPGTRRAGLVAFAVGAAVMSCGAITFWLFPEFLASLLSDKPAVILASVPLLAVAAVFQISDGIQAVGAGVLRGAADTRFAFVANILGHWLIGLPVALYLGVHLEMGIVGLWWGLCTGLTAVAALLLIRFLRTSARPIARVVHAEG